MPSEITVRGSYSAFQAPEHGTVHASIAYEGQAMEPVYEKVARDLEAVKAPIVPLKSGDDGAVTWWSAEQLRTRSNRPWNQVEWALTVKRREKLLKEARTRAVHDAVTRAQQYAEALGLSGVRPVAVAHAGMLGSRPEDGRRLLPTCGWGRPGEARSRTRARAHRGVGDN
jgi:hypothetical protein